MRWLVDLLYLLAALLTAPVWLAGLVRTGKIRTDWRSRFGGGPALPRPERPRILLHAVSVGEVNAVRRLVGELTGGSGGPEVVVTTSTDTGQARARAVLGQTCAVRYFPFDFSCAVDRFLEAVRPDLVVLVELEIWPNFTAACGRRGVPVVVVNGRLTERSFRRYRLVRRLVRPTFRRLRLVAAQSEAYAARFRALGVPDERVIVTGTMKWDSVDLHQDPAAAAALAEAMGIDRGRLLVVAGSTAPGEPELISAAVPEGVQLLCAPRRPEWFEGAAAALPGCARRSRGDRGSHTGRFLLDTIGELRQAYALADVVIIGRSFGRLYGSDMMEPAGLGKPVVIGPAYADFRETVEALRAADAIVETTAGRLPRDLQKLCGDRARRTALADNALAAIRANQGATARHVELIRGLLRGEG